ncbi:hypothetical protein ACH5RR_016000 [Cinchona calisaya]|uniref:RRM domain-containing protein n=1 Tax=Cinchona calisaya TaxID=153742 RepID=A0ABD2ZWQ0_9GENT
MSRDGKSRQFGFVGFRSVQEAEEAMKFFHKSFMDTCRITCEIARKVGDPNIPRPWSQYSLKKHEKSSEGKEVPGSESSKLARSKEKKKKEKNKKDDENDDPKLQEFLQVMQPRSKSKLWANDTLTDASTEQRKKVGDKQNQVKKGDQKSNTLETQSYEGDEEENRSSESQDAEKPQNLVHNNVMSDMDYFKSRVKKQWSISEGEDEGDSDEVGDAENGGSNSPRKNRTDMDIEDEEEEDVQQDNIKDGPYEEPDDELVEPEEPSLSMQEEKEVLESGRLFVRNLPYTTTEEELEEHFCKFGNISQVHIVVDKETKRSKGIAYVLYALPESASRALAELDNSIFQGRLLHVMAAKQNNSSEKQEINMLTQQSAKTFKQQKVEERKASEASGNTRSWNSWFMRSDTVVENIARKFGASKSDILDKEAKDLAVRISYAEIQVVDEMKKALANAGVNIASLQDAAGKTDGMKRSNHVILVKNLPYGSSEGELANMFGKFGSLDKIILPPPKTLALVVYLEATEARAAFRGLAYKRYKDAPLYLEWAPGNILSHNVPSVDGSDNNIVGEHDAKRVLLEQQIGGLTDGDIDPDRVESRSLYVKNLNFKTSDESLKKHFREHLEEGRILSVRVKKHLKKGKNVSMGFGFIEFDSVDTAMNVCRDLQGTVLDGHALILQLCHAKKDEQVAKKAENDRSSTKLIVRNVAFEATEKDLRQLFSPFGQIKSLRLPMRFGNHRGFAFVDYVTKQEAKNALEALSNTHLYGRHLVLERAKEGESLEELRARTAAQYTDGQSFTKLSKKRKHMAVLDEGSLKFERIAD